MSEIAFEVNGGTAPGYLAVPESGDGPATIVPQEWWRVDDDIREVCDRRA